MTASLLEQLADLSKAEVDALIRAMTPGEANAFEYDWRYRARPEQLPPAPIRRRNGSCQSRALLSAAISARILRAAVVPGRAR